MANSRRESDEGGDGMAILSVGILVWLVQVSSP